MCAKKRFRFDETTLNSSYLSYSSYSTIWKMLTNVHWRQFYSIHIHRHHAVSYLLGLGLDSSLHQLTRGRVEANLTGDVHSSVHHHRLAGEQGAQQMHAMGPNVQRRGWAGYETCTGFDLITFYLFIIIIIYFRAFQSCVILNNIFWFGSVSLGDGRIWTGFHLLHQPAADWLSGQRP